MNFEKFKMEMLRLKDRFKNTYSDELVKLIWREVQYLSDDWMTRTTDHFVGTARQPPLLTEFRDEISKSRERGHEADKKQHKKDAWEFHRSVLSGEEIRMICQLTRDRMQGKVSDKDWETHHKTYNEMLKSLPKEEENE